MAAINSLTIEGFKSFRRLKRLELGPLNVLIGANGSGKSNFLAAFELLSKACSGQQLSVHVGATGGHRLLHYGAKVTRSIRFKVRFGDGQGDFTLLLRQAVENTLHSRLQIEGDSLPKNLAEQFEPAQGLAPAVEFLHSRLDRWRRYHFADTGRASPMKSAPDLDDNRHLRPDGRNLAAYLYLLLLRHKSAYSQIRRTVQLAAPFFEDFVLKPRSLCPDTIQLEWRHRHSDAHVGTSSLSDGTLRFMALATLLLQPVEMRPKVILIDEPELGLHPYAVTLLAAMLREASVESQIIVATQSPLLLDHFEPEEVLVTDRQEGATTVRRLSAESLRVWLEDYSLGELWQKNEFGGRPAPEIVGGRSPWASARLMGRARARARRGGIVGWPQARREIANHLKEDRERCVTTMVDYYGLPQEGTTAWPSRAQAATAPVVSERPVVVETAMHRDVSTDMGSGFLPSRFVPFVMFHEFEALLFSDCGAFAAGIGRPALTTDFQRIRDQFSSPEEINDSKNTAPSKRVIALVRGYSKPRMGQLAANAIGLDAMRLECAHFEDWLGQLERLPGGGASRQGNP